VKKIKLFVASLLVILATACPAPAQQVKIVWLGNPDSDQVIRYESEFFQTNDTLGTVTWDTCSIFTSHIGEGVEHECGPIVFNLSWIKARIRAINANGAGPWSDETRWYVRGEFAEPEKVQLAMPAIRIY